MPKGGKKLYYWDTSCFIAWLNGGQGHPADVFSGLEEIAREVTANKAILCTSVVTDTEILTGKLTADQRQKLENLFKRRNVIRISIDGRVSQRASEIRNYYSERGTKLTTPDSIHLATAVINAVDEFHTLDGSGDRTRRNDILALNGDVAGYPLHIRVPKAVQPGLFDKPSDTSAKADITGGESDKKKAAEPSATPIQGSGGRPPKGQTPEAEASTEGQGEAEG